MGLDVVKRKPPAPLTVLAQNRNAHPSAINEVIRSSTVVNNYVVKRDNRHCANSTQCEVAEPRLFFYSPLRKTKQKTELHENKCVRELVFLSLFLERKPTHPDVR